MKYVMQNCVIEWSYVSGKNYADPFNEVDFNVIVTGPDGKEMIVPGFWGGENVWRVRFSSPNTGLYKYRTVCSDSANNGLHGDEGEINVTPYTGKNELYKHGPLKVSENKKYFKHADETPFFWLADTWWMGLTTRLKWPDGFKLLLEDRINKGYSVIQIIAGLYPDMDPFDERGANEAGFPWDKEFKSINPAYFDKADLKIACLVNSGLVPCIVACWGYFADFAGNDVIKKHWNYLIARYGAYPVVWCMAGEADMPFYNNKDAHSSSEKLEEYIKRARKEWTEITRYVKEKDPFGRMITIHPSFTHASHDMLNDDSIFDFEMLQTGHDDFECLEQTVRMVIEAAAHEPKHPVLNSEVCYEGIMGANYHGIQRFLFWSCVLNGACGHTYGANGIWQVNSIEKPYGPSPHGASWGNTPWEEAYKLPGSKQLGLGKKLLEEYDWHEFEPHPEWLVYHNDSYIRPSAFGVSGKVRIIYIPNIGNYNQWGVTVKGFEEGVRYKAFYFDPIMGDRYELGEVIPDENNCWKNPKKPLFQDWVVVMEKID